MVPRLRDSRVLASSGRVSPLDDSSKLLIIFQIFSLQFFVRLSLSVHIVAIVHSRHSFGCIANYPALSAVIHNYKSVINLECILIRIALKYN